MDYRGRWALVTGASAGIGKTFAERLASKGANVALVARREDRMREIAARLEQEFKIRTDVVAADLADPQAPERVLSSLRRKNLDVDVLVNNAGFGMPGEFHESPWEAHRDFIELMATSYVHFSRLAIEGMRARKYGRIVNVASLAGLVPGSAGHTLYGATKAFLVSFSESLAAENAAEGVKVSALCPGFTYSEFHDVNGTRALVSSLPKYAFMDSGPVVEGALEALERGHVVYVPGAWNKFVARLMTALPRSSAARIVAGQSRKFRKQTHEA